MIDIVKNNSEILKALTKGMELFNQEEFFDAHEVWEEVWRDSEEDDRHLLQGLIQVAAGFHKLYMGLPSGTEKLLEKSMLHLKEIPDNLYQIDFNSFLPQVIFWQKEAKKMVFEFRTDFNKSAIPKLNFYSH